MTPIEKYRAMLATARYAGFSPTASALCQLYEHESGEVIHELQTEIDRMRAAIRDCAVCRGSNVRIAPVDEQQEKP